MFYSLLIYKCSFNYRIVGVRGKIIEHKKKRNRTVTKHNKGNNPFT